LNRGQGSFEEMQMILYEIEAILNSRPSLYC